MSPSLENIANMVHTSSVDQSIRNSPELIDVETMPLTPLSGIAFNGIRMPRVEQSGMLINGIG